MHRTIILTLLLCAPMSATVAFVQEKDSTTITTMTLTGNTTIGNGLLVVVSSASPTTVKIGTQTLSAIGVCTPTVSSIKTCAFGTSNLTVASNSVTCTSCGSANYIAAAEYSGVNAIEPLVACFSGTAGKTCQQNNAGTIQGIQYSPGYSSEGILFGSTCAGSSTAPTVAGLSGGGNSIPNGNAVAWGTSSGTTLTSMKPTSGCNQSSAVGAALIGTGATQQPVANPGQMDESTQGTTTASVTTTFLNSGDLAVISAWCITTCTQSTLTVGAQNATCPGSAAGSSNSNSGQIWICYVILNTSGSLTTTFTPTGSPTHVQVAVHDFVISSNTTVTFDTAAVQNCVSACSEGTTIVLPSLTPAQTGSLLYNFVATLNHASAPHAGSPQWSCYAYLSSGAGSNDCLMTTTKNMSTWILSSASGATTPNADILTNNDPYQSVIASFNLAGLSSPTVDSSNGGIIF